MLTVITLTKGALVQANKLKAVMPCTIVHRPKPFKDEVTKLFQNHDQLLFIMATGIVVRTIGPLLEHKSKDPAVMVMDEKGRHIISLLSGHLGGANKLTQEIAQLIHAEPVITTASDLNDVLSIDMFAEKYDLYLKDFEGAKTVTSYLVDGHSINVIGANVNEKQYATSGGKGSVVIGHDTVETDTPQVQLYPRNLVLGIGCRRDTKVEALYEFITDVFNEQDINEACISKICSAWVKSDEVGLVELSKRMNVEFQTFDLEALKNVAYHFEGSKFVEETIGVPCVSEPSGYLGSDKGKCRINKIKRSGMTLSVWEKETCYM